jgi:predicted phosphodiesterase
MRVHILSDLHLETRPCQPASIEADVVVLAGDIANGTDGIEWAKKNFRCPVVYVAGNHEYFERDFASVQADLRQAIAGSRIELLDCGEWRLGPVRFLGCTLWTDFSLSPLNQRTVSIERSRKFNPDYQKIRMGARLLQPEDTIELCRRHRSWLNARLMENFDGTTVVITHFAPHRGSIAPQFAGNPANPGFIVPLDELMGRATLWIHGHTHSAFDYRVQGTRVVANPRGYAHETSGFRDDLIVEV